MTYTGGQAFIGIGLNDEGTDHMDPATADTGVSLYYRMTDENIARVNIADSQTLIESSFVQTDDSSTLMFTQSLDDIVGRDLTEPYVWIWAVRYEGNYFTGHAQMGSVTIALTSNQTNIVVEDDDEDEDEHSSDEETEECFSEAIALGSEGTVELEQYVDLEANTFTIKVTYTGGQAFIGVGLQDNGTDHMDPANAVIGQADTGVLQYRMTDDSNEGVKVAESQTLIESSFEQTDDTSMLTFTQSLNDITDRDLTEESVWIWAVGYNDNHYVGHSQWGSVTFALTACESDETETPTDAPTAGNDSGAFEMGILIHVISCPLLAAVSLTL